MSRPRQDLPPKVAAILRALVALVASKPLVAEIAAEANVSPGYVSVVIRRLESDGYIKRLSADRHRLDYKILRPE